MGIEKRSKESFSVIGKEGSTLDGPGFVQKLWQDANAQFAQVQPLAKKEPDGSLVGIWGAMSDLSRSFAPWEENFSKGLYLAGVECKDDALAPSGWVKWTVPGFEYLCVEVEGENTFAHMLEYLDTRGLPLAGAVHDFSCPTTGKNYLYFPIRRLPEAEE